MRTISSSFTPDRLTMIRERRGWSINTLSRRSEVSVRSIRCYENGDQVPGDNAIALLSRTLEIPAEWFYGAPVSGLGQHAASFRAATKLPAYRRRAALAAGRMAMHLADWIAERFDLPAVDIPELGAELADQSAAAPEMTNVDPEVAAEAVRGAWGLGNQPAPNLVHLLESRGCLVFGLAEDCRELDAFCFWRHGRAFVLLNTMKSGERARMDAAHELAHLVLHRHVDGPLTQHHEAQANRFAAAFLMPRSAMHVYGGSLALSQVLEIKAAWQVAAVALVHRLHALGLMIDWHYRTLMVELSKRGYRRGEPGGIPREQSQLLSTVFTTMRAEGVGTADIAADLGLYEPDLRQMVLGLALIAAR